MPDIFISHKKEDSPQKPEIMEQLPIHEESPRPERNFYKDRKSVHRHPLSPYALLPANVSFETKNDGEKVVLLLRRHPITNLGWLIVFVIMLFAPSVLSGFPLLDFLPDNFRFIAVLSWYMISTAYFLENFLSWFFNVNIITDERIIDVDFYNLIYKHVTDAETNKIQDVSYNMGGVIRTMFDYGDVLIQTASEIPNLEFLAIPHPSQVVKLLQELRIEEQVEALEGRIS